jgi:hypothetical protein
MPGNRTGGLAARDTNIQRHGADFYKRIGAMGGSAPCLTPKGFAANRDLARIAGARGGRISRKPSAPDRNGKIKVSKPYDPGLAIPVFVEPALPSSRVPLLKKLLRRNQW